MLSQSTPTLEHQNTNNVYKNIWRRLPQDDEQHIRRSYLKINATMIVLLNPTM
jgi:hypothetical protein